MRITTQHELRRIFWQTFPALSRTKIPDDSGFGWRYQTNTRVTWGCFLAYLRKEGAVTAALADQATLD